ncbi:MAG TPA: PAS domain S-box protein [Gemmatimonadaceae bacterium]|nr:PAS domain S-box protein [Gemmatimonadaceae bacterium]
MRIEEFIDPSALVGRPDANGRAGRPQAMDADRALANVLPLIVWTCDAQGRLEWVNDRWFELTGLSEEETLNNKGALVAVHPDDRAELARQWTNALETSSVTELEYRIRNTSGEYRWHLARVAPLRDAGGEIVRWVAAVLDVHDRRVADDARRASERRFDSFFHLSPIPMAITRQSDGAFLHVNEAFTTLTGYERDEALGETSVSLGILSADTRTALLSFFSDGNGRSFEVPARTKDGRSLTLLLSNARIEIDGVSCFHSTATDLTERRAMEDALRESEAQARAAEEALRRANQQKDDFLAQLSHELRNPLAPILLSARLLEERVDGDARRDVDIIVRQVKHVSRLVDDLLDVVRIARGAVTLSKTRLEPAIAIARAVAETAPLFEQRGHKLEIDIPKRGLAVDADEERLTQIFDNLLSNAARYTPPRGTIRVSGWTEADDVILSVRDNGRGIEPSLLPHLFETFVQGPRGTDRAEGGLGVGLSLVQALAQLHGATVAVHSDGHGLGSEFTVRLPAAAPVSQKRSSTSPTASEMCNEPTGMGKRVLIVDDHRDIADSLSRLLRLLGYDVRTALNPLDAISVAEAFRPHVALVDLGLPVMDGYTLAMKVRERLDDRAPVLIALSGYNRPEDFRRSEAAGFAAHLTKPVDCDDLVNALNNFAPSLANDG